jgi:hypothetical protein
VYFDTPCHGSFLIEAFINLPKISGRAIHLQIFSTDNHAVIQLQYQPSVRISSPRVRSLGTVYSVSHLHLIKIIIFLQPKIVL